MKKRSRRLLAIVLTMLMCIGSIGDIGLAFADDVAVDSYGENVESTNDNVVPASKVDEETFEILDDHRCIDALIAHDEVAPTCTENGTEAYWECEECHRLFLDEETTTEILGPIVINALGHEEVIDSAVDPTETESGLTEGVHCGRCNEILISQEVVSALKAADTEPVISDSETTEDGETVEVPVDPNADPQISGEGVQRSGLCGDDVAWELDGEGILTISGTGYMNDAPWLDMYLADIVQVVICDGVKNIADNAFDGCYNLVEIAIPNSATYIGTDAFRNCEAIGKITLPVCNTEAIQWFSDNGYESVLNTTPHRLVEHARVELNCTEDGTEAYWVCSDCGKLFADESAATEIDKPVILPAIGHTLVAFEMVDPADPETGVGIYWNCETCNAFFADEEGTIQIEDPFKEQAEASDEAGEDLPEGDKELEEEDPSLVWANDEQDKVVLLSANVEFDGLIHLLIKINIKDCRVEARDNTFIKFTIGDKLLAKIALNKGTRVEDKNEENEIYSYSCPVPIVRYLDTINFMVVDQYGVELPTTTSKGVVIENGYNYSLQTYAQNKSSSTNAKMASLAKALQDYGIATRAYAGWSTDSLKLSSAVTSLNVNNMKVKETVTYGTKPSGVSASQAVIFESDNSLQVTFTLGSGNYTFTYDGSAVTPAISSGKAVLTVSNIAPNHLNDSHSFSISDGTDTFTIHTSVLGYAKRKAQTGSDEMKMLAKALYIYSNTAYAYSNTNITSEEDFIFNESDKVVAITAYRGNDSVVIIPDKINGKPVQAIAANAFSGNTKITEVIVPETVKSIGTSAFSGCSQMREIDMPDTVESIGEEAFANCSALIDFDFPVSLKNTGENIFSGCTKIKVIVVPEGIVDLPDYSFYGATSLEDVELPSTLKTIGAYAFSKCTFTTITVPNGVEVIEKGAFKDCKQLAEMKTR